MRYIRLSFRLSADSESAKTWEMLKQRHADKTEKFIFDELLRREQIRIDNRRTHGDMLVELLDLVREVHRILRESEKEQP